MSYGLKYKILFDSSLGNDYQILIYEKNYAGSVYIRNAGAGPILRMEDNYAIRGTSLELQMEAEFDGDLHEFYTTDNKKFLAEVLRNDKVYWKGYALPELYSEPYISTPFDVSVCFSDGIGILKNVNFVPGSVGRCTLFKIIEICLSATELGLNYCFASTLFSDNMSQGDVMYVQATVDPEMFVGKSCYEVLECMMISLGAYITQKAGEWHIIRYTDHDSEIFRYKNTGELIGKISPSILTLGTVADNACPVGSLDCEIIPAKRDLTLEAPYVLKNSFLENYDFSKEGAWEKIGKVNFRTHEDKTYCVLSAVEEGNTLSRISQAIDLQATEQPIKIEFKYAICYSVLYNQLPLDTQRKFRFQIFMIEANGNKHYITQKGWKTEEEWIEIEANLQEGDIYGGSRNGYKYPSSYSDFKINLNKLEYSGRFTIVFENIYSYRRPSPVTGGVDPNDYSKHNAVYLENIIVTNNVAANPDINFLMNPNASTSEQAFELSFLDTPFTENAEKVFRNILKVGKNFTSAWSCSGSDKDSLINIVLMDKASLCGVVKQAIKGTILTARDFQLFRDKFSGMLLYPSAYSHNLYEDEIECSLIECVHFRKIDGEIIQAPRSSNIAKTETRVSGETEYRSYGSTGGITPKMIRELAIDENILPSACIEVDDGFSPVSKRIRLELLAKVLEQLLWTKEELSVDDNYLLYLGEKIKAGSADLWEREKFSDWLDQPVRTSDDVKFHNIVSRIITLTEGFMTDNFMAGMNGTGVGVVNKAEIHADKGIFRKYIEMLALVVSKMYWRGGRQCLSPAGMKVNKVEEFDDYYRCYMETEDGQTNDFTIGAQARCNDYGNNRQKYYWRLVTGIGSDYIDLSKTDKDGDGIPAVGDDIVQFGHRTEPSLQWVIMDSSFLEDAGRTIYSGVNNYDLSGKMVLRIGIAPTGQPRIGLFTRHGEFSDVIEGLNNDINNAINEAQVRLDALKIGSVNLISKKMMLRWNEKNKNIAVWGQDADGVYLGIHQGLLFSNCVGSDALLNPIFDIKFKANTQYVLSVEWKLGGKQAHAGLYLNICYTDGSKDYIVILNNQTTKIRKDLVSQQGKTILKISASYGSNEYRTYIYNISLIEGNKPLQGFPVAEEDAIGGSINLADGTKEFTATALSGQNYEYGRCPMRVKPNTVYHVQAGNIENLSGNPSAYSFRIYNKDITQILALEPWVKNYDKNGGLLITKNDFEEQDGYLLCYAGIAGSTSGNSVKYTEVMLVEGFCSAAVWSPSAGDFDRSIQNAIAKTIQVTANSQVFKYGPNYTGTPTPSSIVLTATAKNFTPTSYQWQFLNGSTWTNISGATASTYTVSPGNTTLFPSGTNVRTFRCICNGDSALSDQFTLAKLADGATGPQGAAGTSYWQSDVWLDTSAYDEDKWIPFTGTRLSSFGYSRICVSVMLNSGKKPSWSSHSTGFSVDFDVDMQASGWGTTVAQTLIYADTFRYCSVSPVSCDQMTYSSTPVLYLRGGGRYHVKTDFACTWTPRPDGYTWTGGEYSQTVSPQTSRPKPVGTSIIGRGIKSVTNKYAVSASNTTAPTSWSDTAPSTTTTNKYLWNYEIITYTDNTTAETNKRVIGVHGVTGATGVGIKSITEYYLATASANGVTTSTAGWTTDMQVTTTTKKYLWNYEVVTYTDNKTYTSTPVVIGTHGATGASGKDAYTVLLTNEAHTFAGSTSAALGDSTTCQVIAYKGTTQVTATIGTITGQPTGLTTAITSNGTTTAGFTVTVNTSMVTKSGVLNVPVTVDGKVFTLKFSYALALKGATGATGKGIKSTAITYQASTSGTTAPTSTWSASIPSVAAGSYLWTRTIITYTDDNSSTIYSVGKAGTDGTNGNAGKGVKSTAITYQASTSGTTAPTGMWSASIPSVAAGSYLWTRTIITYTDNATSTIYSVGKMGNTGATGAQGIPGESVNGVMKYKDPMFKEGLNAVSAYHPQNNGGQIKMFRIKKSTAETDTGEVATYLASVLAAFDDTQDQINSKVTTEMNVIKSDVASSAYTNSGYCLCLRGHGGTNGGHLGGFTFGTQSRANAVFFVKISAKIPVGYTIVLATNAYGSGGSHKVLTSNVGTGKFETYLFKVICGSTGSFNTTNYFYLSGPIKSATDPLRWYVDYATVFDQTADGYADIAFTAKDEFAQNIGYNDLTDLLEQAKTKGPMVKAGLINAKLINTSALVADDAFVKSLSTKIFKSDIIISGTGTNQTKIENGKLTTVNMVAQNATISGNITAETLTATKGGIIGPFTITESWLTGTYLSMSGTQLNFIINNDNKVYMGGHPDMGTGGNPKMLTVQVGGGTLDSAKSLDSWAIFASAPTETSYLQRRYALRVYGATRLKGRISIGCRVIYSSTTLLSSDYYVLCENTSEITVYLPKNPEEEQVIYVRRCNARVVVHGNGINIYRKNSPQADMGLTDYGHMARVVYFNNRWYTNWIDI